MVGMEISIRLHSNLMRTTPPFSLLKGPFSFEQSPFVLEAYSRAWRAGTKGWTGGREWASVDNKPLASQTPEVRTPLPPSL